MSALNGLIERMDERVGPLPVIGWIAIGGLGVAILAARHRSTTPATGGAGTVTLAPGDTTNGVASTPDQTLAGMLAALKSAGAVGPVNLSLPGGGSAGFTLAPPEPAPNPAPLPDTQPPPTPAPGAVSGSLPDPGIVNSPGFGQIYTDPNPPAGGSGGGSAAGSGAAPLEIHPLTTRNLPPDYPPAGGLQLSGM